MSEEKKLLKNDPFDFGMANSSYKSRGGKGGTTLGDFNSNPGNIMYYQVHTSGEEKGELIMDKKTNKPRISGYAQGLIDQGFDIKPGAANEHGVFIFFKNKEDGLLAKKDFWKDAKTWGGYKNLTVDKALLRYSGGGYDSNGLKNLGIDGGRALSSLSASEIDSLSGHQMKREDPGVFNTLMEKNLIFGIDGGGFSFDPKDDPNSGTVDNMAKNKSLFKPNLTDPVSGEKLNMGDSKKQAAPQFPQGNITKEIDPTTVVVEENNQHKNINLDGEITVEDGDGNFTKVGDFSAEQKEKGELVVNEKLMNEGALSFSTKQKLDGNLVVNEKLMDTEIPGEVADENMLLKKPVGPLATGTDDKTQQELKTGTATMEGTLDPNDPINKEAFEKQGGKVVKKLPSLGDKKQLSTGGVEIELKEFPEPLGVLFDEFKIPGSKAVDIKLLKELSTIGPQDDPKKKLVPGSIAARIAELNLSEKEKIEIAEKSKKALSSQEEIVMSEIDKQKNAKINAKDDNQTFKNQSYDPEEVKKRKLKDEEDRDTALTEFFGEAPNFVEGENNENTNNTDNTASGGILQGFNTDFIASEQSSDAFNLRKPVVPQPEAMLSDENYEYIEDVRLTINEIEAVQNADGGIEYKLDVEEGISGINRGFDYNNNAKQIAKIQKKNDNTALAHLSESYSKTDNPFKTKAEWLAFAEKNKLDGEQLWSVSSPYSEDLEEMTKKQATHDKVLDELFSASKFAGSRFNQVVALFGGHDSENLDFGFLEQKMNEAALMFMNEEQYDRMGGGSYMISSGNSLNDLPLDQKSMIIQKAKMFVLKKYTGEIEDRSADLQVEANKFSDDTANYEVRAENYEVNLAQLYKTKRLLANERTGKTNPDGTVTFTGFKDEEFAKIQQDKIDYNLPLINEERDSLEKTFNTLKETQSYLKEKETNLNKEYGEALDLLNYNQTAGAFLNDFKIQDEFDSWAQGLMGVGERADNPVLKFVGAVTNIGTAYANERLRFEASKIGFKAGANVLKNPYALAVAAGTYFTLDYLDNNEFAQSGDAYSTKAAAFDMITNLFGRDVLPTDKGATIFKNNPNFKKIGEGGLSDFFSKDNLNSDGYLSGGFVYNTAHTLSSTIAYVQELAKAPFKHTNKSMLRNKRIGKGDMRFKVNKEGLTWNQRLGYKIKGNEGVLRRLSQVKHNQKMIMFENQADGRARGLSPEQAFIYGQATTFATGVSQAILPDYRWFKTGKGMTAKAKFAKLLSKFKDGSISRTAVRVATNTAFKELPRDMAGEFVEEGLDMALNDVVRGAFLTNYSPEIQDANAVGQMLSATFVLTTALGLKKGRSNYRGMKYSVYNYYKGNAQKVVNETSFQIQAIEDANKTLDKRTRKGKELHKLLMEEKKMLEETKTQAILYRNAVNVAPKKATVKQLDLIMKKQKLQKKREGLDGATTEKIDKQISLLNEQIKGSSEQAYAEKIMMEGIQNMTKVLKSDSDFSNGEIFEFGGETYADAVEVENLRIQEVNERYNGQIKEIDEKIKELKLDDKSRKNKDKKNKKQIRNLQKKKKQINQSKSLVIDNMDGPGFFYKDGKTGKWILIVNKDAAMKSNNWAVAQHEVLHALLFHTAQKNPKLIKAMGFALLQELRNNPELRGHYVMDKFGGYDLLKDGSLDWEEMLPIFSEALTQGNLTLTDSFLGKMKTIIRRVMREGGYTARIYDSKDVINFIKDYNAEFKRGRLSKGMAAIKKDGLKVRDGKMAEFVKTGSSLADIASQKMGKLAVAKGKGEVDVEQDPIEKGKKSMDFDESFDDGELNIVDDVDLEDFSENEDLVRKLAKGKKNDEWREKEARKAMDIIQSMGVFDRLIASKLKVTRSEEKTKEFTKDVYTELFAHVKNFKPEQNDDLFGWINSQVANKAGNVYNEEVKDKILKNASSPEDSNVFVEDIIDEDADLNLDEDNDGKLEVSEKLGFFQEAKSVFEEGFKLIKQGVNKNKQKEKARVERLNELGFVDGDGNILDLNSLNFLNTPNILYKLIAKRFGVDADKLSPYSKKPFAKNLRRQEQRGSNELLNAQMKLKELGMEFLSAILPEGHTSIFTATGISRTKFKSFYNKGKRVGNNFIWHKKPVIDVALLENMLGIVDGKSFREDRLAQQSVISMLNILGSQASKQMLVSVSKETGDLNDQIRASIEDGKSKYSKSIFYIENANLQETIREGLPEVGLRIASEGLDHYSEKEFIKKVRKIFRDVYGDSLIIIDEDGKKINGANKLADQMMGATGVIMQYGLMEANYKVLGVKPPRDLGKFIKDNLLNEEKTNLELFDIFGISRKEGEGKLTKDYVFTKDMIIRGRKNLVDKFEKIEQLVVDEVISEGTAYRWIMMMKGMYASQGVLGNNEFMAKKPGSMVLVKSTKKRGDKSKGYITKQYSQVVESAEDYHALLANSNSRFKITAKFGGRSMLQIRKDYKIPANFEENSKAVIGEIIKGNFDFEARKEQALEARELVKFMFKNVMVRFNDPSILNEAYTAEDVVQEIFMMGSGMESPTRKAAYVYGMAEGLIVNGKYTGDISKAGQELEYDHLHPHHVLMLKASKLIIEGDVDNFNDNMDSAFKDFVVNIIPKTMDNAVKAMGMQYQMQEGYVSGLDLGNLKGAFGRLYGAKTFGDKRLKTIEILDPSQKGKTIGQDYTTSDPVVTESVGKKSIAYTEAIRKNNEMAKSGQVKGISIWDFDDTLARSNSNVLFTTPDGKFGKLTAEEFAKDGARLLDLGYVYDFSEFSKVVDGKPGPFLGKFVNRIKKFGIKDNFILTARPENSAAAIQMFLKELGIEIPIENITGLANSTPESKAMWIVDKVAEGYNDIYFADDALQNVQVVENVLNQFDVKSKVRQAKGKKSKDYSERFNKIIEEKVGIEANKVFSEVKGQKRGEDKGRFRLWIPPSAEDFVGLLYNFMGKGKKGEADMAFFKESLLDPYAKGYNKLNTSKQQANNEYKALIKKYGKKKLREKILDGDFTKEDAVRVYLWNKAGFEVPGISQSDMDELVNVVVMDGELKAFADSLGIISKTKEGYVQPTEEWVAQNIGFDLLQKGNEQRREDYLKEFKENRETMFGKWGGDGKLIGPNMNKIEAAYGKEFRNALEDILWRMENGSNRSFGQNKMVNNFMNYINGSIGATMFFNARSAVLQTLSMANFVNWEDNNIFNAASAFANQGQFWEDFTFLFQSDMLKQRRSGMTQDLNAAELMQFVTRSKSMSGKMSAAIQFILQKGFLPTQMADSFAIASGGATFYRNRINKYVKEGMDMEKAKKKAFLDFQEIAESTQQSSRPDLISQQQASVLGRLVLAFQNTPMQYSRLQKKAFVDLMNGRGDAKSHVSRILYYGFLQNILFYSLQSALFALPFLDDDEEEEFLDGKKERMLNGMLDSSLRGIGVYGAILATIKNMVNRFSKERDKKGRSNYTYVVLEFANFSPPVGIKMRKLYNATQTYKFNRDEIEDGDWMLGAEAVSGVVEATTNLPLNRMTNKVNNLSESLNSEHATWQRISMVLGWNRWDVGLNRKRNTSKQEGRRRVDYKNKERRRVDVNSRRRVNKKKKERRRVKL